MPIIELHGFGKKTQINSMREMFLLPATTGDVSEDVGVVFQSIEREVSELSFSDTIFIEICDSFCVKKRKVRPYIRIVTRDLSETMQIIIALEPLGFDMQVLLSNGFYPAKTKQS